MHKQKSSIGKTIIISILFIIGIIFLVVNILTVSQIRKLASVSIRGVVASDLGKPIKNAIVTIQNTRSRSDETGEYILPNLKWGWNTIQVDADGFLPYQDTVYLPFGTTTYDVAQLRSINFATLKGRLKSNNQSFFDANFTQAKIKINSSKVDLQSDGTFESEKISIQKVSLLISIPGYDDYYKIFELGQGQNDLGDIELVRSTKFSLQLKNKDTGKPIQTSEITINNKKFSTEFDGSIDLTLARFLIGEKLNIEVDGFKDQSVIYQNNLGSVEILLESE